VTLALDVPVVTVSGTITVDGPAGPPGILGGSGELYLVSDSGVVILGSAASGSTSYSVPVVPGTYEILYEGGVLGTSVPTNQSADLGCFTTGFN